MKTAHTLLEFLENAADICAEVSQGTKHTIEIPMFSQISEVVVVNSFDEAIKLVPDIDEYVTEQ